MINFPNAPAQGQTFSPPGGYQYIWLDGVWRVVEASQNLTALPRNRLVNPCFQISQENGSTASGAIGYYVADQWAHGGAIPAGYVWSSQRVQSYTPNGSLYRWRHTVTTGAAIGASTVQLGTAIEGIRITDFLWGAAQARQVVLRFGWKSPAGTYSISLRNAATNRAYVAAFTVSAGQANTDTTQTFVIPGDTTGVWQGDTAVGIYLSITLACGGTYAGVAGWQAGNVIGLTGQTNGLVTSAVYELFDCGLYLDPLNTGTPPRWEMPDEAAELAACLRYWERFTSQFNMWSGAAGWNTAATLNFLAAKRIPPAQTAVRNTGAGTGTTAAFHVNTVNSLGYYFNVTLTGEIYANVTLTANARM